MITLWPLPYCNFHLTAQIHRIDKRVLRRELEVQVWKCSLSTFCVVSLIYAFFLRKTRRTRVFNIWRQEGFFARGKGRNRLMLRLAAQDSIVFPRMRNLEQFEWAIRPYDQLMPGHRSRSSLDSVRRTLRYCKQGRVMQRVSPVAFFVQSSDVVCNV